MNRDFIKYFVAGGEVDMPPVIEKENLLDSYQEAVDKYTEIRDYFRKYNLDGEYPIHIYRIHINSLN